MPAQDTTNPAAEIGGPTTSQQQGEDVDRYPKTPNRFIAWVMHQSTSRLLGLLLGNTRELETALAKAEGEVLRVRSEASKEQALLRNEADRRERFWQTKFSELSDSVLLSKGLLPMSTEARKLASAHSSKVIEPKNSVKQMELEIEADKLLSMLQHGDFVALQNRIEDLLQSGQPKDKKILQLYAQREAELQAFEKNADIGMGVVVGVPSEIGRVS